MAQDELYKAQLELFSFLGKAYQLSFHTQRHLQGARYSGSRFAQKTVLEDAKDNANFLFESANQLEELLTKGIRQPAPGLPLSYSSILGPAINIRHSIVKVLPAK